jgi:hypothetical protein
VGVARELVWVLRALWPDGGGDAEGDAVAVFSLLLTFSCAHHYTLKATSGHMPTTEAGCLMLNKFVLGVLLLISTLAVGAWPLTVPARSATSTATIQTKGSIVKITSWANAGIGYQLTLGRQPVCTRLRNAPDTGDPFCKPRDFQ